MARPKTISLRDHQLNLSLTQAELDEVRRRADRAGLRIAAFARLALLARGAALVPDALPADGDLRRVHAQLRRLGNNLNQMARHLHATGDPAPPDLEPLLRDIRSALAEGPGR